MRFKQGDLVMYDAKLPGVKSVPKFNGWVAEVMEHEDGENVHIRWIRVLSGDAKGDGHVHSLS